MFLFNYIKRKIFKRSQYNYSDIDPDEIFLDSKNIPQFDTYQFEGRIERPISWSTFITLSLLCVITGTLLMYKIWNLQVNQGKVYAEISANNSLHNEIIVAPRGVIYDRNGIPLAWNMTASGTDDFARRAYTQQPGFGHFLGYLKYPAKDNSGFYYEEEYKAQDGMEEYLNETIAGKNGLKITETDASHKVISESLVNKPEEGQSVFTSIDSRIQNKLYENIASLADKVGFKGGAGIIIDVNSGEVLAMTSYPEYDPAVMTEGGESAKINNYFQNKNKPFLNRSISGLYAPGSVVKPFMAFGALEEGVIDPNKIIYTNGKLVVPNPYFPDKPSIFLDWRNNGALDMRHAIAYSSDVYFYEIGGGFGDQKGLGIANIDIYLRKFGFGASTGSGIAGEEIGNIPTPEWKSKVFDGEPWRIGDTYHTVIGQYGMQATPMQVARAIAAIANSGKLVEPTFIKQATSTLANGINIGGDPEHYQIVREGMRLSVLEGTSKGLNMGDTVKIGGKTGTAELGVAKDFVNSWTTGFFPYDNPHYAYLVVMESGPVTNLTGATFVMRQLMDWMVVNTPEYLK